MSTVPDHESPQPRTAIICSISSDIGLALADRWLSRGWRVAGTHRTVSDALHAVERRGATAVTCDLASAQSVESAGAALSGIGLWDTLVLAAGQQEPVGAFADVDFDEWEQSLVVNFSAQMRLLHRLLPNRRTGGGRQPSVIFFAGGGTNNAPVNYSAYILAKIASIKACELLDAEIPDTKFTIIGPGWVATKIHDSTLKAGERAGSNYQRTIEKLASDELTPMADVLDCIDWAIDAPREVVSGRNFSVVFDRWGDPALDHMLRDDSDMYRLRRMGNDRAPRPTPVSIPGREDV